MTRLLIPALCLTACPAPAPPPPEDLSQTLPAAGPWGVGYQQHSLTWDPAAACAGTDPGARELRVAVWYPTDASGGSEPRYLDIFPAPGVILDAEPAPGPFPPLVYSHGSRGYAEASGRLVRHLVSHGHVVVAPDHAGNTFFDPDQRTTAIYWQRPHDLGAALDWLAAGPLAAHVSDDPVLGFGHSFGGYTLHAAGGARWGDPGLFDRCADGSDTSPFCSTMTPEQRACFEAGLREPRIASVFSMAPGDWRLFTDPGLAELEVPVVLMTGGLDDVDEGDRYWAGLARPGNTRVHITDAGHNAFSDVAAGLDAGPQFIDAEEGWRIMGAYLLAWSRQARGDAAMAPVFDGTLVFGDTTELSVGR